MGEEPARHAGATTSTSSATHEPPMPAELMQRGLRALRGARRPSAARWTSRTCSSWPTDARRATPRRVERFRARFRAITVDEYQDVNLLQQALLDHWLGERDDLCVVGDDYQAIYSFTGATPRVSARDAEAVPERDVVAARGRTTARRRRCSSSRTGSCRSWAASAKKLRGGAGARPEPTLRSCAGVATASSRVIVAEIRRLRRGEGAVRGDGGAVPDQPPLGRVRRGAARRPGSRSRSPAAASSAARRARGALRQLVDRFDEIVETVERLLEDASSSRPDPGELTPPS